MSFMSLPLPKKNAKCSSSPLTIESNGHAWMDTGICLLARQPACQLVQSKYTFFVIYSNTSNHHKIQTCIFVNAKCQLLNQTLDSFLCFLFFFFFVILFLRALSSSLFRSKQVDLGLWNEMCPNEQKQMHKDSLASLPLLTLLLLLLFFFSYL